MKIEVLTGLEQIDLYSHVYIWGNGKNGKYLNRLIRERKDIVFEGYIIPEKKDEDDRGNLISEVPKDILKESVIIITPLFWMREILNEIKEYNVKKIWISAITSMHEEYLKSKRRWQDIVKYGNKFVKGKEEWFSIMNLITLEDISRIWQKNKLEKQYIEFNLIKKNDAIIDGGAFFSEEIDKFKTIVGENGCIYAFDPLFSDSILNDKNVYYYDTALSNITGKVSFDKTQGTSSALIGSPEEMHCKNVMAITIDEFVENKKISVDFIKLDVEGAEKDVIEGARKTIINQGPNMAIAVYHSFDDFFDIIDLISSVRDDYKFIFAGYSNTYSESILYAYLERKVCRW